MVSSSPLYSTFGPMRSSHFNWPVPPFFPSFTWGERERSPSVTELVVYQQRRTHTHTQKREREIDPPPRATFSAGPQGGGKLNWPASSASQFLYKNDFGRRVMGKIGERKREKILAS